MEQAKEPEPTWSSASARGGVEAHEESECKEVKSYAREMMLGLRSALRFDEIEELFSYGVSVNGSRKSLLFNQYKYI